MGSRAGSATVSAVPGQLLRLADSVGLFCDVLQPLGARLRSDGYGYWLASVETGALPTSAFGDGFTSLGQRIAELVEAHRSLAITLNQTAIAFQNADSSTRLVRLAMSQVGYLEQGNNRTKFGKWYGSDGEAWCAKFVSWSFAQSGTPLPSVQSSKGFAAVRSGFAYAVANNQLTWTPQPGDVFLIRTSGQKGHTGLVVSVDEKAGTITTIEGNTNPGGSRNGDGVYKRTRRIASINRGFWRPQGSISNAERTEAKRRRRSWE